MIKVTYMHSWVPSIRKAVTVPREHIHKNYQRVATPLFMKKGLDSLDYLTWGRENLCETALLTFNIKRRLTRKMKKNILPRPVVTAQEVVV